MHHRHVATGGELGDAAYISGRDELGSGAGDVGELAVAQSCCDLRLQQIIGSGRAAAQVPFRHLDRLEARRGEECLRSGVNTLPVLHRAGGMISDAPDGGGNLTQRRAQAERRDHLGDIASERGDPRRLLRKGWFLAQHEAVILDRRAATGGIYRDGVEPGGETLAFPRIDVGARETERRRLLAEMVGKRSATAAAARDHDFATVAGKQPDRRLVDLRCQHPLGASRQQRDPHSPHACGCEDARSVHWGGRRHRAGGKRK